VVDKAHWDGLPDGRTRAVVVETIDAATAALPTAPATAGEGLEPLSSLLARRHADITVAARPLSDYAHAAQTSGTGQEASR
jgi:hypothetical protein